MGKVFITAALLSLAAFSSAWADNLPTIRDVYAAAKSGHLDQARSMVDTVLAAKPDSAKAHYVKAEICASQSDLGCVRSELSAAKRIDPGLGFANPAAVGKLERIAGGTVQAGRAAGHSGFPWGWLLIGLGVVALLMWIVSIANRRGRQTVYPDYDANPMANGPMAGPGMGGMYPGYGAPMQTGGGLGSSIGRGLATGAAIGAGMVAGEALADGLFHHNGQSAAPGWDPASNAGGPDMTPDLGGNDFGIGGDSWDSGSGDLDSLNQGDW